MWRGDMAGLAFVKFSGSLVAQGKNIVRTTNKIIIVRLMASFDVKKESNLVLIKFSNVLIGDVDPVSWREKMWKTTSPRRANGRRKWKE
jgi:hypothetical protein